MNKALKEQIKQQCKSVFNKKRYWLHIIIWVAVALYFFTSGLGSFEDGMKAGMSEDKKAITVQLNTSGNAPPDIIALVASTVLGAIMAYSFLLFFIPLARHKKQKRYLWLGFGSIVALWILFVIASSIILAIKYRDQIGNIDKQDFLLIMIISAVFSGVTAGLFFSCYYLVDLYDQLKHQQRYKKTLVDRIEAETNFLKTQINPHFLFNTLNNIFSLTLSKSEAAGKITDQLNHLITYMIQDCAKAFVPLHGEIAFLENYIALERLRNKAENVTIIFETQGNTDNITIAPLLLINFIENAFKHGVKAGIDHAYVHIYISTQGNVLQMSIANSKPQQTNVQMQSIKEAGGIGIKNVKRRLAILYPNRHKLKITESNEQYTINLNIELNQA